MEYLDVECWCVVVMCSHAETRLLDGPAENTEKRCSRQSIWLLLQYDQCVLDILSRKASFVPHFLSFL